MPKRGSRNLVVASAILLAVVIAAPVPQRSIGMQVFHDFGHGPVFGVIAIIALRWLRERRIGRRWPIEYAVAFLISVALGVAVEVLQIPFGRNASLLDVRGDVFGAVAFLAFCTLVDRRIEARAVRIAGAVLGCAALAAHSLPLVQATLAYKERNARFPVLFDARERYDDYFLAYHEASGVHIDLPPRYATVSGERALALNLQERWSPYLILLEPVPDWREYRALALDLTNPAATPMLLKVGVYDRDYDDAKPEGFVRVVTLPPQQRITIRIPIADIERDGELRRVDVSRVHFVKLFDEYAKSARDVYVARVWLE